MIVRSHEATYVLVFYMYVHTNVCICNDGVFVIVHQDETTKMDVVL